MSDASSSDGGNAAQVLYWNDRAATTWTTFQERMDAMLQPITDLAVASAAPRPGEQVIDVGCGCGATVLELARRVGPDGHVLGVDISRPMLARAEERIQAQGLGNAVVAVSDASSHPFPPGEADLLFSRFGVMFFADPSAAFANLRRAMRPGGRLLFAAWRTLAENSWFSVPLEAARPLLPPQPPFDPEAPGPLAFANPDRVRAILTSAGWKDVNLTPKDAPMRFAARGQADDAIEFATRLGPLARILAEADPDLRVRVRGLVANALQAHEGPQGFVLGGAVWLVAATA